MGIRCEGLARAFAGALLLAAGTAGATPVLFVTHTPSSDDFTSTLAVFGNHSGQPRFARRGGDLWIRYDDGTLRNLTQEAGFGQNMTVRDPCVHWDGAKALFSMAVGGTTMNANGPFYFQIYEATGIGQGQTVAITPLPQETNRNNVSPIYGTDDRIIFTSDRPRNGAQNLYPQVDEYESSPTNTGIWRMNADGSGLELLDHAPSGDFTPIIDSFGRVVFTRWDHLQRDQQADADIGAIIDGDTQPYGSRQYDSEESNSFRGIQPGDETFPELRFLHGPGNTAHPVWDADHQPDEVDMRFNQFFPWMMNQDGTDLETLNHIGRQELFNYAGRSRTGHPDHNLTGPHIRESMLQIREDPTEPGRYIGTAAPEFGTHASGQIVVLEAPVGRNAATMGIEYVTHEETCVPIDDNDTPTANHVGLFRDPMPKTDGTLWAAHSSSPFRDDDTATDPGPPNPYPFSSRYDYRIRRLEDRGDGVYEPTTYLTTGITETINYFDNQMFRPVTYSGPMWELQPVEVVARTRPVPTEPTFPAPETNVVHGELGGPTGMAELKQWLVDNELALVVSRDVTVRADRQQYYRLKVADSTHETTDGQQPSKEIGWMQFFEGRQVRGYQHRTGRRVIAQPMVDGAYPEEPGAPPGAVKIGDDGSVAAFVPARRALSWQTTAPDGTPSVRERYWITFQPGEMRSCANCHGVNDTDVFGDPTPENEPEALVDLLRWWKTQQPSAGIEDWQSMD